MNKKTILFSLLLVSYFSTNYAYRDWGFHPNFERRMKRLLNEFDNIQDNNDTEDIFSKRKFETGFYSYNIYTKEKDNKWGIEVTAPGFDKKDFKIKINSNGYLQIKARKEKREEKSEKKDEPKKKYVYYSSSSESQAFSQTIKIPEYVEYKRTKDIAVKYVDGILTIEFPMKSKKKIKINEIELTVE